MGVNVFEGKVVGGEERVGIVCARCNEFIVSKLLGGAIDGLVRHGMKEENIDVAWVPGAFEIPLICEKMAKSGKYDAVIALGTVIRGATAITIMYATRYPRVWLRWAFLPVFRCSSAS